MVTDKVRHSLYFLAAASFLGAALLWLIEPSMPKTSNELGIRFEGSENPPGTWVFRDPCLAYKCDASGQVASGQTLEAFDNYENPQSPVYIPADTRYQFIDMVSVTTRPGKLQALYSFKVNENYQISRGDFVFEYADWGEGCITAWHNGKGFAFRDAPMNGKYKYEIGCLGTFDWERNADRFKIIDRTVSTLWVYAAFENNSGIRKLYFKAALP